MKFSITGQEKCDLLKNVGDCLIEMAVWAGLTLYSREILLDI